MTEEKALDNDSQLTEIIADYRRQKLIEHVVGPIVATSFHILLFFALTIFIALEVQKEDAPTDPITMMTQPQKIEFNNDSPIIEPPTDTLDQKPLAADAIPMDISTDAIDVEIGEEITETIDTSTLPIQDFKSPLKSSYANRSRAGMAALTSKYKSGKATILAVDKALKWLAEKQNPDGSWGKLGSKSNNRQGAMKSLGSRPALTGLALLTFLAQGETHLSENYGKNIRQALTWLSQQMFEHRYLPGSTGQGYDHLIATYALAEAAGITEITDVQAAMEVGINQILKRQNSQGAFGYSSRSGAYDFNKSGATDTSLSAWAFQALKAASIAGSLNPNIDSAKEKIINAFAQNYTMRTDSKGRKIKGYGYKKNRPKTIESNSAFALLCLQLEGRMKDQEARESLESFKRYIPQTLSWDAKEASDAFKMGMPLYTWYYATQILFNEQDKSWDKWNSKFQKIYLENQKPDGHWESPSAKEYTHQYLDNPSNNLHNSQIYSTAFCAITLTVYYRNLPTSGKTTSKKAKTKAPEVESEIDGMEII